jgi:hypothetical protein
MTRPNRHRIQRQIVELTIDASSEGPAVYQALARPFWDRAVPELEHVFDQAAGPDELLQVERLELDLGTMGGGEWVSEFRRRLVAELTRTLAQFTATSEPGEDGCGQRQPAEAWRLFQFFLVHGRLPWWAAAPPQRWNVVLAKLTDADWSALQETVVSDPRVLSRLVYSVDDELLERAIAVWSGVPAAARVLELLAPERPASHAPREWRRGFWTLVLEWIANGGFRSPRGGPHLVRELMILRAMCGSDSGLPRPVRRTLDDARLRGDRTRPIEDGDLPEPWRAWWLSEDDVVVFDRSVTDPPAAEVEPPGRASMGAPKPARAPQKRRSEPEDEAIYLPGAGAILVHPFLEQLFHDRGLLERRSFCGLGARHRAVHLIGYLTFGRMDVAEYELVLPKALCGVELDEPLEPMLLEDDDLAACDALVRAVLEHWTALRGTSPQWLREQFFLREGKLERVDAGWLLTIERHAQDVLLARLPWGFGVVAPAWLEARIFVRWLD